MDGQRRIGGLMAILGVVATLGALLHFSRAKKAPPEPAAVEEPVELSAVEPVEVPPAPDAASPPPVVTNPFSSDMDYFGGQTSTWWTTELSEAPEGSPRRELLLQRVKALGLQVESGDGGHRVTPTVALVAALNQRKAGKKLGAIAGDLPQPTPLNAELVRRIHPSSAHATVVLAPRQTDAATAHFEFALQPDRDGAKPGLTLVALYALLTGNERDPYARLKLDLYEAGAEIAADVQSDRAIVTLQAPPDRIEGLVQRVARMLFDPNLSSSGLSAAKRRVRQHTPSPEVAAMLINTLSLTARNAPDPERIKENIEGATLDEVRREARAVFCPANATIVVAGRFKADGAARALGGFRGGQRLKAQPVAGASYSGFYSVPSLRSLSLIAYPITVDSERSLAGALLISSVLQELVQNRARQQGIAYAVSAEPVLTGWGSFILLSVPLSDDAPSGVGDSLEEQVAGIANGGIDDQVFARNRASVLRGLEALQRDDVGLAAALLEAGRSESAYGESMRVELEGMAGAEVTKLAKEWLNQKKAARVEFSSRYDKFEWTERK